MASALGVAREFPKWVVGVLAIVVSVVSISIVAEPLHGVFRTSFGEELRFIYLLFVSVVISFTIYTGRIRGWSAVRSLLSGLFAGYVGSVLAYYCLAMPALVKMVRAGNLKVLFAAPLITFHIPFAVGALEASLLMWGLFAIYSWRHS